jgi:hypothetical protein
MARKPKGSYFRNSPDWFASRTASAGTNNPSQTGDFAITGLYNNATDGSCLWVWWVSIQNGGAFSIRLYMFNGHTSTFQDGPGQPLNPTSPIIPGHVYVGFESSHAVPVTNNYITSINQPVIDFINPPGPVCIIPPGWSLRLASNQTDFGFVANFYWTALPDSG